ncbi:16060_t:CDS:2, partial [Funneliformis caledonium]
MNFNELDWNDKFQLALQLSSAVECIHECNIIHRDLHASNILVHQKNIKLADFGLSRKIAEASSNATKLLGVLPYVDPKLLECWKYEPEERPNIREVVSALKKIVSFEPNDINEEINDQNISQTSIKSNEVSIDINKSLEIDDLFEFVSDFSSQQSQNFTQSRVLDSTFQIANLPNNSIESI